MKNILVMGAGIYQVPLIKKIKEMGGYAIVVSPKGNYPGLSLANEIIDLDTRDRFGVLEKIRQIDIAAVLTTGSDVAVPTIGYLVDKLGLFGTGFEAAQRSMDKTLMKRCFAEHDVLTAEFVVVNSFDNLKSEAVSIGFPVMVKAIDSSGSRGITQVLAVDGLKAAYESALSVSESKNIIVEKFLEGREIGAQAVVVGDEVIEVFLHSDEVTLPPISAPVGHAMPLILGGGLEHKTKQLIKKAISSLGIRNTISNIDIMIVNGEPYIIEVGARMGATCLAENISIYAGFDVYEFIIRLSLGEIPSLPNQYIKQANAVALLRVNKSGVVKNIDIPNEARNHPDLINLSVDIKVGEAVKAFKYGPDRVGQLIVKGDTFNEANNLAKTLISSIVIEVEE